MKRILVFCRPDWAEVWIDRTYGVAAWFIPQRWMIEECDQDWNLVGQIDVRAWLRANPGQDIKLSNGQRIIARAGEIVVKKPQGDHELLGRL